MKQAFIVFILFVGGLFSCMNTRRKPSRQNRSLFGRFNRFVFNNAQLQPLFGSARLLFGFAFFAILSFCQSNSADGQSSCPCGCGGVGGHIGGQAFRGGGAVQTSELEARIGARWESTATDASTGPQGNSVNLSWGIVDEGTPLPNGGAPAEGSSFINFLDNVTNRDPASTGGADLTQREWFSLFTETTNRISQLSGVTFDFEPNDDGVSLANAGVVGTRADIRIGGRSIDGQAGPNTLAFAFFPQIGDVVFDTDNVGFYSSTTNNSVAFRNVLAHELFHSLGFNHVDSSGASFLLNPFINTAFDGPQLDDILVLQRNYGDFLEATNGQAGNDTIANATNIGNLFPSGSLSVGQAVDDTVIAFDEVGFVSIDDESDVDIFEFFLDELAVVTLGLSPEGATYLQGVEGGALSSLDSQSLNDLGLRLLDANGTEVAAADLFGVGEGESLTETLDAGTYFVEVSGSLDEIQLYSLALSAVAVPEPSSSLIVVAFLGCLKLRRRRG